MGTHYKVYIFDDTLCFDGHRQAKEINTALIERKASVYEDFEYVEKAECIIGELRKDHPDNHLFVFGKYDNTYYKDDCGDACLTLLTKKYE